jgi:hypothetical protein
MMSRGEFLKEGRTRLSYLLQQVEREAKVRASNPKISHLDDAQIKLAAAEAEFLDFLYDRFVELEGSLIIPSRPSTGSEPVRPNGTLMDGREPRSTEKL